MGLGIVVRRPQDDTRTIGELWGVWVGGPLSCSFDSFVPAGRFFDYSLGGLCLFFWGLVVFYMACAYFFGR